MCLPSRNILSDIVKSPYKEFIQFYCRNKPFCCKDQMLFLLKIQPNLGSNPRIIRLILLVKSRLTVKTISLRRGREGGRGGGNIILMCLSWPSGRATSQKNGERRWEGRRWGGGGQSKTRSLTSEKNSLHESVWTQNEWWMLQLLLHSSQNDLIHAKLNLEQSALPRSEKRNSILRKSIQNAEGGDATICVVFSLKVNIEN